MCNAREMRGKEIAMLENQIKRIDDYSYKVKSQSSKGFYDVSSTELGWICSCPDHVYRGVRCKHTYAVEFSLALRNEVKESVVIGELNAQTCISCNSNRIVKDAIRHNKAGDIQRYLCKECGKRFSFNIGFEGMKSEPKIITTAMQLYFSGESLRNTAKSLTLLGANVSHVAVYGWIKKYISLMKDYVQKLKPNVGNTWRADELFVKFSGNMKYVYALMDDETRYWIAQQVADSKYTEDVRPLFKNGKEHVGRKPQILITDGAWNFQDAFQREFWSRFKADKPTHIRKISMKGKHRNNNKMERLNGEVRIGRRL